MIHETMKERDRIREEFTELLDTYYNGFFAQLACDYIRSMEMTQQKVEEVLEDIRKVKGA